MLRRRTRWRCGSTCSRTSPSARAPRAGSRELVRQEQLLHRDRLRRNPARLRRAGRRRARRRRLPPAAADRVPVVALPGLDGRDHGVGALGQHAAGRLDQRRRDDLVQPLRARRRRRLPAPGRRRTRARRTGLSHAARAPTAGRRTHGSGSDAAHPLRRRQRSLAADLPTGSSSTSSCRRARRRSVELPDGSPFEASAGRHRFECPYRPAELDPARPPRPVPLLVEPES